MTRDEVDKWIEEHNACYPNYKKWLARQPNLPAIMDQISSMFRDITLEKAIQSSREMSRAPNQPKSPADYARLVRARAVLFMTEADRVKRQANYVDGQETFQCQYCHDSGVEYVPLCGHLLKMEREHWLDELNGKDEAVRARRQQIIAKKVMAVPCRRVAQPRRYGRAKAYCGGAVSPADHHDAQPPVVSVEQLEHTEAALPY